MKDPFSKIHAGWLNHSAFFDTVEREDYYLYIDMHVFFFWNKTMVEEEMICSPSYSVDSNKVMDRWYDFIDNIKEGERKKAEAREAAKYAHLEVKSIHATLIG